MVNKKIEIATFAGGCFWCMVKPFDQYPGIIKVVSGFSGGHTENPTYEEVCGGQTGHYEVVQITFDSSIFPYSKLLEIYWMQIDPTDAGGQFLDRGQSYQTAIFYHDENQKMMAEKSKAELEASGKFKKSIATPILPAFPFYAAEEYHQDFYKKNPERYALKRKKSGLESFLKEHWDK